MKLNFKYFGDIIVVLSIIFRLASPVTADISYVLIAIYALYGRSQSVKALILSWFFSMLNSGIADSSSMASLGRYTVLFAASVSVLIRSDVFNNGFAVKKIILSVYFLGFFFAIHSLIVSPVLDVSLLKVMSWTLYLVTIISAWTSLELSDRNILSRHIFIFLIFLLICSIPLLASNIGYLKNGTGFQGLLNQPQVFGSTMALLGVWAILQTVANKNPSWLDIVLIFICVFMIIVSECRTSGFALIIGVCAGVFTTYFSGRQSAKPILPGLKSQKIFILSVIVICFFSFNVDRVEGLFTNFVSKSGRYETTTLLAAYERSRGALIDVMLQNIENHPFFGIGFGVASNIQSMKVQRDPLLGIPIGASVEKGVLPIAVVEEVGLIGLGAVIIWILFLFRQCIHAGVIPVSVGLTIFMLNMGEATFFSPGGMGLLPLVLIGWIVACAQKRHIE